MGGLTYADLTLRAVGGAGTASRGRVVTICAPRTTQSDALASPTMATIVRDHLVDGRGTP